MVLLALGLFAVATAAAQTSAGYKLQETTFNNGGNPGNAGALASAHFHIKLDSIGDGVAQAGLSSVSFHLDGSYINRLQPPGEVTGLQFTNATTLAWDRRPAAQWYEVYRGTISSLPGTFGACFAPNLAAPTTTDASVPAAGTGLFYLVTARNGFEEGTKGFISNGTERGNPLPCP
jgi:hypothetical protein